MNPLPEPKGFVPPPYPFDVPADVLEHIYERAEPVGGGTQNTAAVAHGNGGCGVGVIDGGFSLKADFSAESKSDFLI